MADEKLIRAAKNYLRRAKLKAAKIGLTEWEDGFLESLKTRIEKYGRAFTDPDLGAMDAPFSLRQGLKIREIKNKDKLKKSKTVKTSNKKPLKRRKMLKRSAIPAQKPAKLLER